MNNNIPNEERNKLINQIKDVYLKEERLKNVYAGYYDILFDNKDCLHKLIIDDLNRIKEEVESFIEVKKQRVELLRKLVSDYNSIVSKLVTITEKKKETKTYNFCKLTIVEDFERYFFNDFNKDTEEFFNEVNRMLYKNNNDFINILSKEHPYNEQYTT